MNLAVSLLSATTLSVIMSGCVSSSDKNARDSGRQNPDYALIAENLVDVLGSLESINRINTTFQMLEPTTAIGDAVVKAVEDQGYGIQRVTGDLGDMFLRYKAELSQTESGVLELYSLSVANHSVQRQYAIVDGKTTPISPVTVRTDSVIETDLDDSLFGILLERSVSSVIEMNTAVPEVVLLSEDEDRQGITSNNVLTLKNVRSIEESNFQSIFASYDNVSQQTLAFENDSLVLGLDNKVKISNLATEINPDTDIVSVIGCSHGKTQFENGNQLLAEGRAQRVTESLMFAGLDPELIFDEACWASEYWDEEAPRRGVMVTHKRLKDKS